MKILLFIILLSACVPNADQETFYADHVIDGDTFIANGRKIRIWGIDTPEKDEAYYQTATLTLESLIEDALMTCNFVEVGKYKRDVMRCYVDGQDIGALMVQKGMAKNIKRNLGEYYMREEIDAQKNKRGIWGD